MGRWTSREVADLIPWQAQRQDSVSDQLDDLELVALRLGMYDAHDWLRRAQNEAATARQPARTCQCMGDWHRGDCPEWQ